SKSPWLKVGHISLLSIQVKPMSGMYRVTRDGQLREIVADVTIIVSGIGPLRRVEAEATAHIEGEVKDRRFTPHGFLDVGTSRMELPLEPVEVPAQVSVLNPLHPV